MAKNFILPEDVEREIARLEQSPMVALAQKYDQVRTMRRNRMQELQRQEDMGIALHEAGVTMTMLQDLIGKDYAE